MMSMPGIAEFSSLMILAEIGDVKCFTSPKELVSYAGLCCGIYQTGNTERTVHNTAVNKWLKWIIYKCSGRALMLIQGSRIITTKSKKRKDSKPHEEQLHEKC